MRPFAGKQEFVEVEGRTVGDALQGLVGQYGDLRRHFYNEDGRLRSFVNIYVNDEDIRHLEREQTPLKAGDTISIVPSVAGGSPAPACRRDAAGLTRDEVQRYSRHLIMPEVGMDGQRKLKAARVLCVGAGGLGSPAALYLAAAGVGTLGLVDFDVVDVSNLQRQILHGTPDVGRPKLAVGARPARRRSTRTLTSRRTRRALTSKNALDIFKDYDIIVDGTDNFPTRYLVNDACVLLGKPNAYGSIFRFDGQASVFATKGGRAIAASIPSRRRRGWCRAAPRAACSACCPASSASIQATEAIKLILGAGEPLVGRLLLYDALQMRFRELKLRRDPDCPVCGDHPTIHALIDYDQFCGVVARRSAPARRARRAGDDGRGAEGEDRSRRRLLPARRARAPRVSDLPDRRVDADPARRAAARLARARSRRAEIVVHCKFGARSAKAVALLQERGFTRVQNLKGGILAWIDRVDPSRSRNPVAEC